jgi:lipopolysaccharide export system protein LptA
MRRYWAEILSIAFCVTLFFSTIAPCATAAEEAVSDVAGAITVHSRALSVDHSSNIVTFSGDVRAVNDEMVILCREMKIYYNNEAAERGAGDASYRIQKIVSTGDVRITRAMGGEASAETVVYHQAEEKMILTGNPVIRQGKDYVEGDRIVFFIRENRSIAESAEGGKVKAVIFPRGNKK